MTLSLDSLPAELLLLIAQSSTPKALYNLRLTTRYFYHIFHTPLHQSLLTANSNSPGAALLWACQIGHLGFVHFLLDHPDYDESSSNPYPYPDELISFHTPTSTPLIAAVRADRTSISRIFCTSDYESGPGARPPQPLPHLELRRRTKIVQLLLSRGVDPNQTDSAKKTALHYAAQFGDTELCVLLLRCGARAGPCQLGHYTPLHLAVYWNRVDAVRELLNFDAVRRSIPVGSEEDDTAMSLACSAGYVAVVEMLLGRGAEFSVKGDGDPMQTDACAGQKDVVVGVVGHFATGEGMLCGFGGAGGAGAGFEWNTGKEILCGGT